MIIDNIEDLKKIRDHFNNKKIVFCSGSFDLPHVGHVLFFEDCKKLGNILAVGIGSDKMLKINKGGNRPILNELIRLKTINSFKPVDYSFIDIFSNEENPLLLLKVIFEKLKPDIYVINEDAFDIPHRKAIAEKFNVKLVILKRYCPKEFEEISTSRIIQKIIEKQTG